MTTPRAVLAQDLLTPDGALLFLAPFGLSAELPRIPLPCLALRVPASIELAPPPDRSIAWARAGDRSTLLFGSEAALGAWATAVDSAPVQAALLNFRRDPAALRFADETLLPLSPPAALVGVLNVTPDSFSDGGRYLDLDRAVAQALTLAEEGAALIDIGGESTRPGAAPVDPLEERRRVLPVVEQLMRQAPQLRLSIDTRHVEVARAALDAGAAMINDISALDDPRMAALAAERKVPVVLMHMRGTPTTMQRRTDYTDLLGEVAEFLLARALQAEEAGIASDRIALDPGFGFGKSVEGNRQLLVQLAALRSLGWPLYVGLSRKSFIGAWSGVDAPSERLAGSLAAAVLAQRAGAALIRTHDVAATRQALAVAAAVTTMASVSAATNSAMRPD